MTARFGSRCAASSPTARSRARSRSRPPAPAIPPPSPGSRPGTLDPQRALAEAYRRNNAGSYAESSEFFAALTQREGGDVNRAEALVNEALQKSNLGRHAEADSLFSRAASMAGADPVTARRLRNYRAMHLLNQGLAGAAVAELDRPVPPIGVDRGGARAWSSTGRPRAGSAPNRRARAGCAARTG